MEKKQLPALLSKRPGFLKALIYMKLSCVLLLVSLQLSANVYSQNNITLKLQSADLRKALVQIEKKSSFRFLYNDEVVLSTEKVDVDANDIPVIQVLDKMFAKTSLTYKVLNNNLVVVTNKNSVKQDIVVTGKVTSSSGEPLGNISVTVKGSTIGTNTSTDGSYSISVPDGATLVFSSVGYETQEIPVNGRTEVNVVLQNSTKLIDQVVVVGYGTQRRRDLTGSISSVSGSEITKQPVQTATQAIQGKVAGVQIIVSGEPNSNPTVRLRGTGSTLAGANPLYVVDGVLTDDIRNVNSADIISMDILKDASSTAIYGVRGANGVIIITTRKGRTGAPVFNYDATLGVREAAKLVDMAGEKQYAGYLNEASIYYGSGDQLVPDSLLKGVNQDWYDAILRKAFYHNHSFSLSGGSERVNYFLSAGYLNEEGIQINNRFKRLTVRSNNEYTLTKKLKFFQVLSYTNGYANGANFDAFGNAYRAAPNIPAKVGDKYGNTSLAGNVANPLLGIEKNYANALENRIQGNLAFEYKPIKGLTLRSAMNIDLIYLKSTLYGSKYLSDTATFIKAGGNQSQPQSTLSLTKNDASSWIWDNTATYIRSFGKHTFTLLGGITAQEFKYNSMVGTAKEVPANRDQWYLNSGLSGTQTVVNTGDKYRRASYLARLNYGYDNRYLLTATFRADGSSKFSDHWGNFPSFGLGWNISNESFMKNQKIFDNLKLRGSYGAMGNDNIGSNFYYSIATQNLPYYFDGVVNQGIAFDAITDENLKWETTKELDLGIDFSILRNRLSGTFDYYNKKVDDAVISIKIPAISGDEDYYTNATAISNKGIELSLSWSDNIGKDWTYSIYGNLAHNKNRIEKLNGGQPLIGDAVGAYNITKTDNGYPIGSYYLAEVIGVFQNEAQIAASNQPGAVPGDFIYADISGPDSIPDGVIDNFDRKFFGSYQPKITYGFGGSLGYKGFDLGLSFYGLAGNEIYNGKRAARGTNQLTDNLEADAVRDRWTPNNPGNIHPRATLQAQRASNYFLEKGDFLRLNNVTLGFTLPKSLVAKGHLTNLRVFVTAQNLFTVTPYDGFTPELQAAAGDKQNLNQGLDTNSYPTTRSYVFGINLAF